MKILILTNYFPPEIGAASHLFYELSESLVRRGHKVTVITGFPRYNVDVKKLPERYHRGLYVRGEMNDIRVIRLRRVPFPQNIPFSRGLDHFLIALVFLWGGLIAGKHDVIFFYSPPLTLGLSTYFLSRMKKAPFVINVQDLFPQNAIDLGILKNSLLIRLFEAMERFIYEKATCITVHSEGNREGVVSKGADPGKVMVIPNWVDTDFITPCPGLNRFRKESALDNQFIVSFAGIMGYSQDLETIIQSARLLRSYQNILFLLVGDGIKKKNLERKAKEWKLDNVRFLPMQPRKEYSSILNASDISLVTLKRKVGTPVVPSKLLSIMASGCPVIASMNLEGDAPKIIQEAKCGYCVEPENPERLAQVILKLHNNPSLREKLGRNGREYVERYFSRATCVEMYERLFLRITRKLGRE